MKSNYAAMSARIRATKTLKELDKVERSAERLYNAGVFTVTEYSRLCVLALEQIATIDN